jgi:hypothetical protein
MLREIRTDMVIFSFWKILKLLFWLVVELLKQVFKTLFKLAL